MKFYKASIRATIDYGSEFYFSSGRVYLNKLRSIKGKAFRMLLSLPLQSSMESLNFIVNCTDLETRRENLINNLFNKCMAFAQDKNLEEHMCSKTFRNR